MHTVKKKRDIPYGVINWAQLVRECLFVDNTAYIRNLERVRTPVFLRPKRFGKSVVCSMLAHYYDVNLKDRFDELFGRTDIGRNPTPLRNSFSRLAVRLLGQALAYRKALARRPDWGQRIAAAVVEVCGSTGYNWFDLTVEKLKS